MSNSSRKRKKGTSSNTNNIAAEHSQITQRETTPTPSINYPRTFLLFFLAGSILYVIYLILSTAKFNFGTTTKREQNSSLAKTMPPENTLLKDYASSKKLNSLFKNTKPQVILSSAEEQKISQKTQSLITKSFKDNFVLNKFKDYFRPYVRTLAIFNDPELLTRAAQFEPTTSVKHQGRHYTITLSNYLFSLQAKKLNLCSKKHQKIDKENFLSQYFEPRMDEEVLHSFFYYANGGIQLNKLLSYKPELKNEIPRRVLPLGKEPIQQEKAIRELKDILTNGFSNVKDFVKDWQKSPHSTMIKNQVDAIRTHYKPRIHDLVSNLACKEITTIYNQQINFYPIFYAEHPIPEGRLYLGYLADPNDDGFLIKAFIKDVENLEQNAVASHAKDIEQANLNEEMVNLVEQTTQLLLISPNILREFFGNLPDYIINKQQELLASSQPTEEFIAGPQLS